MELESRIARRLPRKPFLLALLWAVAAYTASPRECDAADPRRPYPSVIAEIERDGKIYTAVLIEAHWNAGVRSALPVRSRKKMYAIGEQMVRLAENQIRSIYAESFPERAAAGFFDDLWSKTPLFDSRSQTILLFEGREFEKLAATLKSSWPNAAHPALPSAEAFRWAPENVSLRLETDAEGRTLVKGGIRELKAFTVRNPKGEDLMPTLLAAAQRLGIFSSLSEFVPYQDSLEGDFAAKANGVATGRAFTSGKTGGFAAPWNPMVFAAPETYYLACDPRLLPYYRKLGFEPVPGVVSADGSLWLRIDSKRIKTWFQSELKHRPGRRAVSDAVIRIGSALPILAGADAQDLRGFARDYNAYLEISLRNEDRCRRLLGHFFKPSEPLDPDLRPRRPLSND